MALIVAEKEAPHGALVVVTDKALLGKKFEEGKVQLDLTKKFYEGKEESVSEIKQIFQKARHLHLTGKKAVALGIELNLVEQKRILHVQGIPHAQVVIEW